MYESKRSRNPPWPGMMSPLSFMPALRFMTLSIKSPATAAKKTSAPSTMVCTAPACHPKSCLNPNAVSIVHSSPPSAPSTVLLGEILMSCVRPKVLPKAYAPTSEAMMQLTVMTVTIRPVVHASGPPKRLGHASTNRDPLAPTATVADSENASARSLTQNAGNAPQYTIPNNAAVYCEKCGSSCFVVSRNATTPNAPSTDITSAPVLAPHAWSTKQNNVHTATETSHAHFGGG
mmetsp:Transcript_5722/g.24270  ORF Transcript_5722/g.24270 Transcript_5722/m.24270 type:complete len:233 (+) Transcript_5722:756-1454(+)